MFGFKLYIFSIVLLSFICDCISVTYYFVPVTSKEVVTKEGIGFCIALNSIGHTVTRKKPKTRKKFPSSPRVPKVLSVAAEKVTKNKIPNFQSQKHRREPSINAAHLYSDQANPLFGIPLKTCLRSHAWELGIVATWPQQILSKRHYSPADVKKSLIFWQKRQILHTDSPSSTHQNKMKIHL